jgi:leucyl/phenylalanyl-tRNA--protein transferase
MPVFPLSPGSPFPDPRRASPSGLLAIGGDLSVDRLTAAYRAGIFPWFSDGQPLLWWSPDPRMVLPLHELHVPRSLRKVVRKHPYRITADRAFESVIDACAGVPRTGQPGTWITREMRSAYVALHRAGRAHSVEAWADDGALVGGLYGVATGGVFAGESMFALRPDASKVAFALLGVQLARWGFELVDCQMHTEHLARFGARLVPRDHYLSALARLVDAPTPAAPWRLDDDLDLDL